MTPIIYYRQSLMEPGELNAACKKFSCVSLLTNIEESNLVISRYSVYPFPLDQEKEILNVGAVPLNSYRQHKYIADLGNYVADLGELTPQTWDNLVDLPDEGPFVLKGETNSRKADWDRDMFAPDKKAAINIHSRLCADTLIGQQKIYIRKFVPLVTYLKGIGGIPVTKEYRFFVCMGEVISGGYYWQNYAEDLPEIPDHNEVPQEFLQKVIDIIKPHINFFVIDVAQTQDGNWIVVELNDGSQSGLSCNDPNVLYSNLKKVLEKNHDYPFNHSR